MLTQESMPTPEIKPRDVMPEDARTLPARVLRRPGVLRARDGSAVRAHVDLRRTRRAGREPRAVLRPRAARREHHHHARRGRRGATRSTTSAGTAARSCAPRRTARFAGSIQCPYHAWTYDLDGRLIGAPHMDEVPHFRKADYPLHRVDADVWDGHIFINLDPQRRAARRRSSARFPASSARGAWRTSASATASSTTSRRTGS